MVDYYSYEDFVMEDYDEVRCNGCAFLKIYPDWDDAGPERAGGMAAKRVMVYRCSGRPSTCQRVKAGEEY